MSRAVAQFCAVYGAAAFASGHWRTRTGQIPAAVFLLLLAEIPAVQALQRINAAAAGANAIGLALGADGSERVLQQDLAVATGAIGLPDDVALRQDPEVTDGE